jgi:hypothetical protein
MDETLREFIDKISAEVAKMPAWKQGLLEASMKSMNDEPRKPVTTKGRAMKVEGIPEGYELIRLGKPQQGDWVLYLDGKPKQIAADNASYYWPILRKIERPKQYRPFANAQEFEKHCDRCLFCVKDDFASDCNSAKVNDRYKVLMHNDYGIGIWNAWIDYKKAFDCFKFAENGAPFGVEVSE